VQTFTDIPVNADAGYTIYDPIDDVTFEAIRLNGKQGSQSFVYTLSEYPLVPGREYEVIDFDNQPDAQVAGDPVFTYADYVCFTPGCMLETPDGAPAVEDLKVGDLVETLDGGAQPIRWIGSKRVFARAKNAPIRVTAGVLGCDKTFEVSPQHHILLSGHQNELYFRETECFAAAKHLANNKTIFQSDDVYVEYIYILFDHHEVVLCNGVTVESFHLGKEGEDRISVEDCQQIKTIFPQLAEWFETYGPTARKVLEVYEVQMMISPVERLLQAA